MFKEKEEHNEKLIYSNIIVVKGNSMEDVINKLEDQTTKYKESGYNSVRKIVQVIKLTNKVGIALFSNWKRNDGVSQWD